VESHGRLTDGTGAHDELPRSRFYDAGATPIDEQQTVLTRKASQLLRLSPRNLLECKRRDAAILRQPVCARIATLERKAVRDDAGDIREREPVEGSRRRQRTRKRAIPGSASLIVGSENRISFGETRVTSILRITMVSRRVFAYSTRVTGSALTTSHDCPPSSSVVRASKLSGSCSGANSASPMGEPPSAGRNRTRTFRPNMNAASYGIRRPKSVPMLLTCRRRISRDYRALALLGLEYVS
jgi:hypothetical protein